MEFNLLTGNLHDMSFNYLAFIYTYRYSYIFSLHLTIFLHLFTTPIDILTSFHYTYRYSYIFSLHLSIFLHLFATPIDVLTYFHYTYRYPYIFSLNTSILFLPSKLYQALSRPWCVVVANLCLQTGCLNYLH